jgi:hypothetical protein
LNWRLLLLALSVPCTKLRSTCGNHAQWAENSQLAGAADVQLLGSSWLDQSNVR